MTLAIGAGMQPFIVTARLGGGFAIGAGWGVALDGLLAAEIWAEQKANLRAAGTPHQRLIEQHDPVDLPLPLARCISATGQWHWAATCAYPGAGEHPRDVRTWTGRMDNRIYRQTADQMPATMPTHQGRWRNRIMPVLVTVCETATWRGIGHISTLERLLTPIAAIGKKRSQGEGQVLDWHIQADPSVDPWESAHLHPDSTLGRPAPESCLHNHPAIAHGGLGTAGVRPPYQHSARQQLLLRPTPLI